MSHTDESSCPCAEQEEVACSLLVSALVELLHLLSTVLLLGRPIDSADVEVLVVNRPVLDDVEHCRELGEDEDLGRWRYEIVCQSSVWGDEEGADD